LQQVVFYDKGSIFLLAPKSKVIARVARRGPMPLIEEMDFMRKSEGLCSWVIENAKPVVIDDVASDSRYFPMYLDTRSEMDVPIILREKVLGVFNLESNTKGAFSKRDRRLVQALAGQAAIAIDNAWLYSELLEKKEMERELKVAKKFQRALLPRSVPAQPLYEFAAVNIPSRTVGGDLYDFILFADGRIGITIGDVSGKGTPGAILMATLYSTYRGLIRQKLPINKMVSDLNNLLKARISSSSFVTFFYGELAPDSGEFIYCNAGHCPPILLHADGKTEMLHKGGTVLGFINGLEYELGRTILYPDDMFLLYTDGVTEAAATEKEMYGEDRLLEFMTANKQLSASMFLRRLFREIRSYSGENRLQDDFTVICIKGKNSPMLY
jgi:phosphoserine phosphatase RsbU/P